MVCEILPGTEYVNPTAKVNMTHPYIDRSPVSPKGRALSPPASGLGFDLDREWIEGNAIEHFPKSPASA